MTLESIKHEDFFKCLKKSKTPLTKAQIIRLSKISSVTIDGYIEKFLKYGYIKTGKHYDRRSKVVYNATQKGYMYFATLQKYNLLSK